MPAPAGSLIVVGAGRIGLSLAADLAAAGLFSGVTVVGRRPAAPAFLADSDGVRYVALGAGEPSAALRGVAAQALEPEEVRGAARCLLLCVPDDRLAGAAATWAETFRGDAAPPPAIALHTSGFHPAAALAGLARVGAATGSWHPLVALAAPRRGAFAGITVALEGDADAVALGRRMAAALGARTLRVRPGAKARYHAAAVLASNLLVACLAASVRELDGASEGEAGLADLLPLARSTLEALEGAEAGEEGARVAASAGGDEGGLAAAEAGGDLGALAAGLTGPIARGDVGTVRGHLEALDPDAARLYRGLSAELLRLAEPRLPPETTAALRELLAGAREPREPGGA